MQEIIIQNFRAKPGTKMARAPEPSLDEQLWTIAVARVLFGPSMSIQAPPNLQPEGLAQLIDAGINDWGGVSPVTPDHVNPEAPWPHLAELERRTAAAGRALVERLALGPAYAREPEKWTDAALTPRVRRMSDANGWARTDKWYAGSGAPLPPGTRPHGTNRGAVVSLAGEVAGILARAQAGEELSEAAICRLFAAQGRELELVLASADRLRAAAVGETVTYIVNRNINYTNICSYRCGFCAFSKGRTAASMRGPAYNLDLDEIAQRTIEAHAAGATEVCLQGGIHPSYTGETYLAIAAAVKAAVPSMHVHAFSPLEVTHGARTLGLPLADYLARLKDARPLDAAGHGRGDPRRRDPRAHLPRQAADRRVARGHRDRAPRRPEDHGDDHVRAPGATGALGAPPAAPATAAGAHWRHHRAGAARLRAHGSAAGARAARARGRRSARRC
ncbi:MAG: radical SAM protein [Rubrivivax sp.]